MESLKDSKDLSHFLLFYIGLYFIRDRARAAVIVKLLVAAGAVISIYGFAQVLYRGVELHNRISGFQGMYMTYAGLLMLIIVIGSAYLLDGKFDREKGFIAFGVGLMLVALALSLTRNSWIGVTVGATILLTAKSVRWAAVLPVLLVIGYLLSPTGVKERAVSIFDPGHPANRERLMVWGSGLEIIRDYPVTGVGQNSFPLVYEKYRRPGVAEPNITHLHNNFLEIAVERGLLGLSAFMAIWAAFFYYAAKILIARMKTGPPGKPRFSFVLHGPVAVVAAFLSAGCFEYNFGDSEVQMLTLFLMSFPFVGKGFEGSEKC